MTLTDKEARYIAKYVKKGIEDSYKNNYTNIEINISGKNGILGAKRKRNCWILYVKTDDKIDTSAKAPAIPVDIIKKNKSIVISNDDILLSLITIIESSVSLKNMELDLKKIPLLDEEDVEDSLSENETSAATVALEKNSSIEDDIFEEDINIANENKTSKESLENYSENDIKTSPNTTEESKINKEDTEETKNVEKPLKEDTISFGYEEEDDDFELEFDDDFLSESEPDEIQTATDYNKDENNIDEIIPHNYSSISNIVNFRLNNKILDSLNVKVDENSYLYNLMGNYPQKYLEIMNNMNQVLMEQDPLMATSLFIDNLNRILALNDNNVEKVSDLINIDKRDIFLAIYEKEI